jgi:hypothetical protein
LDACRHTHEHSCPEPLVRKVGKQGKECDDWSHNRKQLRDILSAVVSVPPKERIVLDADDAVFFWHLAKKETNVGDVLAVGQKVPVFGVMVQYKPTTRKSFVQDTGHCRSCE